MECAVTGAVTCATLEAARSSTCGRGRAPSGLGPSGLGPPWGGRAARGHQVRPEEGEGGELGRCQRGRDFEVLLERRHALEPRVAEAGEHRIRRHDLFETLVHVPGCCSDPGPVQRRAKPMPTPTPTLTLTPTHTPAHAPTPAPRSYAEAYQAAGKGARTKPLWCGRAAAAPGVHKKLKVLGAAWLPLGDRLLRWLLALLGGLVTRVQLHRSAWPHARLAFRAGSWKGWGAGVHWLGRRSR